MVNTVVAGLASVDSSSKQDVDVLVGVGVPVVAVPLVGDALLLVGDAVSLVGDALLLVGDALSLVGDALSLVGDAVSLVGDAVSLVGDAVSLVGVGPSGAVGVSVGGVVVSTGPGGASNGRAVRKFTESNEPSPSLANVVNGTSVETVAKCAPPSVERSVWICSSLLLLSTFWL
ncbi:hypothetical protein [Oryzihumus leptocrescens]|uniref:hypothetical protein n=1 Tax=Oryzihumus leptocrescens TaxID=297536 RepID=UPI0011528097|nr:hypothetical protein [Oryzihumus leptocrescens]